MNSEQFNKAVSGPDKLGAPGNQSVDLSWLVFKTFEQLPDEEPPLVISGLLRKGEKLGITAG